LGFVLNRPSDLNPDFKTFEFKIFLNESAACGEGDDLQLVVRLDEGLSEVTWQNGFLVEFHDDRFTGETKRLKEIR